MTVRPFRATRWSAIASATLLCLLSAASAWAVAPSFNGAEGYGGTLSGSAPAGGWFSTAQVYHVNTTADTIDPVTNKPAFGTLRGAFYDYANPSSPKQSIANRIVVFDVGGTFNISSAKLDMKTISNIYIAGQTAPSPVTVYGNMAQITKSNNTVTGNVILRYMTFRKGTGPEEDAVSFTGGDGAGDTIANNMILDHVTASWAEDENLSVTNNNSNITVQYSLIHDALVNDHAYGSLIRPKVDSNVTFHHNLYANNSSRQARFGTYNAETLTADFRNNVIYNYRDRASYAGGSGEPEQEFADVNYVGNYIIAGPGTGSVPAKFVGTGIAFAVDQNVTARVHQYGNSIDSNGPAPIGLADASGKYNGADTGWGMFTLGTVTDQTLEHMDNTQFPTAPVTTQSAADAYNQVVNYAGNSWSARDVIDTRVVNNVRNYTGPALAQAAPIASELTAVTGATSTTRGAGWDTDADGMPNDWELKHGLNPNLNTDFKLDFDSDGYVNVQEYLDEIGAFPAPTPLTYVGGPTGNFALITNWKTADLIEPKNPPTVPNITHAGSNWQPTKYDEARIDGGIVTVSAPGQHAGLIRLGNNPGDNATLNITGGWLEVTDENYGPGNGEVVIGANVAANAALNLSGGVLDVKTLSKGAGGNFNFTGGTLHADTVNFSLTNNGGTLSPGHSVGQTQVVGDLTLNSGSLAIELASTSSADKLLVSGSATLGGALNVSLLGGFTPASGNSWTIITAGSLLDNFASITAGYGVVKQGGNLLLYFGTPPGVAGDYNNDGTVDAADYVVWRDNMNTSNTLPNDTTPGTVVQADYDVWAAHFGQSAGSGSIVPPGASVPEPASGILFVLALGATFSARRRARIFG